MTKREFTKMIKEILENQPTTAEDMKKFQLNPRISNYDSNIAKLKRRLSISQRYTKDVKGGVDGLINAIDTLIDWHDSLPEFIEIDFKNNK